MAPFSPSSSMQRSPVTLVASPTDNPCCLAHRQPCAVWLCRCTGTPAAKQGILRRASRTVKSGTRTGEQVSLLIFADPAPAPPEALFAPWSTVCLRESITPSSPRTDPTDVCFSKIDGLSSRCIDYENLRRVIAGRKAPFNLVVAQNQSLPTILRRNVKSWSIADIAREMVGFRAFGRGNQRRPQRRTILCTTRR